MEKLINILPYLITNDNTNWLTEEVKNPDELSQEIMRFFNNSVYSLSILKRGGYNLSILGDGINDQSSIEELQEAIEKNVPVEVTPLTDLLEEVKVKLDCNGKSATSVIWAAAILNKFEEKNVDDDLLQHIFYAVASTLKGSGKNIGMLHDELIELTANDTEIANFVETVVSLAFLQNELVQESDSWYDFHALEPLKMVPNIEINSKETLFEILKDANNYIAAVDYIKTQYLSETTPGKNGYCENDSQRTYKATIIAATLASVIYKDNEEFDKDNLIGLNLTANILHLQDVLQSSHVLTGVSNTLNALEDDAGKIASEILGREIVNDLQKNKAIIFNKSSLRTGSKDDYIKNNLRAFNDLIAPGIRKSRNIIKKIKDIRAQYADKSYRGSTNIEAKLNEFAKELDVELITKGSPDERLKANLDILQGEALYRYRILYDISHYYGIIRNKQKANLNINELSIKDLLTRDDNATFTDLHETIIKEYYKAVASDPILKSDKNKVYVLKSARVILSNIKEQIDSNPNEYPELSRMFNKFKLTPREQVKEIFENSYMKEDGTIDETLKDLDEFINDSKIPVEDKIAAIEASSLNEEDKNKITEYLTNKLSAHTKEEVEKEG